MEGDTMESDQQEKKREKNREKKKRNKANRKAKKEQEGEPAEKVDDEPEEKEQEGESAEKVDDDAPEELTGVKFTGIKDVLSRKTNGATAIQVRDSVCDCSLFTHLTHTLGRLASSTTADRRGSFSCHANL